MKKKMSVGILSTALLPIPIWFANVNIATSALLPSLKDFAELTGSLLTVEESKQYCVVAELTNRQGFDITESSKIIRAIFTLANHIGIGSKDGETCISLIFDCTCLE